MKKLTVTIMALLLLLGLSGCIIIKVTPKDDTPPTTTEDYCDLETVAKPVIYLYPTEEMTVKVRLTYRDRLTSTYPEYDDGWTVHAKPDGTLTDTKGREYYCLFWEGVSDNDYDLSKGFVVAGNDTAAFLENALSRLGLNQREANEFIIYWLPQMEANPYNLISFQTDAYTENAVLDIEPQPDSMLRVFMAWKPLDAPVEIEPQILETFERTGFTVVEWGGTKITK